MIYTFYLLIIFLEGANHQLKCFKSHFLFSISWLYIELAWKVCCYCSFVLFFFSFQDISEFITEVYPLMPEYWSTILLNNLFLMKVLEEGLVWIVFFFTPLSLFPVDSFTFFLLISCYFNATSTKFYSFIYYLPPKILCRDISGISGFTHFQTSFLIGVTINY